MVVAAGAVHGEAEKSLPDHAEQLFELIRADLADGYSFEIDSHRASLLDLAQWIDLERKCCPFFTFELGVNEAGNVWLNLRGREGVKQFIASDFQPVFERVGRHALDTRTR
jgi:hypothetical protein